MIDYNSINKVKNASYGENAPNVCKEYHKYFEEYLDSNVKDIEFYIQKSMEEAAKKKEDHMSIRLLFSLDKSTSNSTRNRSYFIEIEIGDESIFRTNAKAIWFYDDVVGRLDNFDIFVENECMYYCESFITFLRQIGVKDLKTNSLYHVDDAQLYYKYELPI